MEPVELDILISRYLDGSASSEEVDALEQRIGADHMVAGEVYQAAYLDALLRDACVTTQSAGADDADAPAPIPLHAHREAAAQRRDGMHPNPYRLSPAVRWGAIAACLLLAAAVVWRVARVGQNPQQVAVQPTPSPAHIIDFGPGVSVERAAGPWDKWEPLAAADRVQTAKDATATVAYDTEATRMKLAPNTNVRLISDKPAEGKRWELLSGAVSCQVDHQSPDRPLIVQTPQAKATVVGTKFELKATGDWTRLEVTEGTVRMTRVSDNATVYVSAGQFVEVGAPGAAAPHWAGASIGQSVNAFWSTQVKTAGVSE